MSAFPGILHFDDDDCLLSCPIAINHLADSHLISFLNILFPATHIFQAFGCVTGDEYIAHYIIVGGVKYGEYQVLVSIQEPHCQVFGDKSSVVHINIGFMGASCQIYPPPG